MKPKEGPPGRLSATTPAAVLGCILFVAAVVFATVQAGFADACYCAPCSYSEYEQSKITSSVLEPGCGGAHCLVNYTRCKSGPQCEDDGAACIHLPSSPCSVLLCNDK